MNSVVSEDVYKAIPHREPFLFIDEILEVNEQHALCKRVIRLEEPQFAGHYPGNPIMPGVLLCEAVFQAGAVYLMHKFSASGEDVSGKTPVLSRIKEAKFKQMIKPGDEVMIEVTPVETMGMFHFLKGKILKEGKVVLTLECALALVDEKQ